jgi:hypothetical protein
MARAQPSRVGRAPVGQSRRRWAPCDAVARGGAQGRGTVAAAVPREVPPFMLIGAVTRVGGVPDAGLFGAGANPDVSLSSTVSAAWRRGCDVRWVEGRSVGAVPLSAGRGGRARGEAVEPAQGPDRRGSRKRRWRPRPASDGPFRGLSRFATSSTSRRRCPRGRPCSRCEAVPRGSERRSGLWWTAAVSAGPVPARNHAGHHAVDADVVRPCPGARPVPRGGRRPGAVVEGSGQCRACPGRDHARHHAVDAHLLGLFTARDAFAAVANGGLGLSWTVAAARCPWRVTHGLGRRRWYEAGQWPGMAAGSGRPSRPSGT